MKNILRSTLVFAFLFLLTLTAQAATKPKSEVYKYYTMKLPTSGYNYYAIPYSAECGCAEIDMTPTANLHGKIYTVVFGVYNDKLGNDLSSSAKLTATKTRGGSVKLINGHRWWYEKLENGSEMYAYEPGYATIGYRILVVFDKGIDKSTFAKLQADTKKVIKSIHIVQKKPKKFP